jgi:hypothetical protein
MDKTEFYIKIKEQQLKVCSLKLSSETEKPVLVFLHDSLGCITLWRDFPELLAEKTVCNAIIYDRQGYG